MKKIKFGFLISIIPVATCFASFTSCAKQLDNHYLWITSNTDFRITCKFDGMIGQPYPDLQYSDDYGLTWWKITEKKPYISFSKGKSIALKGNNPSGLSTNATHLTIDIESNRSQTKKSKVTLSGRLMALIDNGNGNNNTVPSSYCFYRLFDNADENNIISEANLIYPTTLTSHCFASMFANCSNLNVISVNFSDWNDSMESFNNWLSNISSTGTFTCPSDLPTIQDASHIPTNWEIKNND